MVDAPNPALLKAFGTDDFWLERLEKTAFDPALLARAAAPVAFMGLMAHEHHREARQLLEAQILTEMFRSMESGRMAPVQAGLRGHGPMLSDAGNAAQQLRAMAAYEAMMRLKYASVAAMRGELEKDAGLGSAIGGAVRAGRQAVGKLFGRGGQGVAGLAANVKPTTAAGKAGMGAVGPGGAFRNAVSTVGTNTKGVVPPAAGARPTPPRPPVRPQVVGTDVDPGAAQGLFSRSVERPGGALTAPAVPSKGVPKTPAAPPPTGAPAAAPAPLDIRQGLRSARNKALLYGGGAAVLGGTGYAGYKGLQTAKDYMMQPSYMSSSWGPPGMMPTGGVNEYGYQDVTY
jgi:hypothetical protein